MFVTNFDPKQLVQYYVAIQRHKMYSPPYELWIEDKPGSSGLRQDGMVLPNDYSLHVSSFQTPDKKPNLSLFWAAFREVEAEANGIVKRV